jgi:hypothetical protein
VFGGLSEIWVHSTTLCDGHAFEMAEELAEVAAACGDRHLEALAEGARAQLYHLMARHKDALAAAARALEHIDSARRGRGASPPTVTRSSLVHVTTARSVVTGLPDRAAGGARPDVVRGRAVQRRPLPPPDGVRAPLVARTRPLELVEGLAGAQRGSIRPV